MLSFRVYFISILLIILLNRNLVHSFLVDCVSLCHEIPHEDHGGCHCSSYITVTSDLQQATDLLATSTVSMTSSETVPMTSPTEIVSETNSTTATTSMTSPTETTPVTTTKHTPKPTTTTPTTTTTTRTTKSICDYLCSIQMGGAACSCSIPLVPGRK